MMSFYLWKSVKLHSRANWLLQGSFHSRTLLGWTSHTSDKPQNFTLTKTINATPSQVYDVVSEVSKYHEFIPYCIESFVNERNQVDNRPTEAGLRVGFRQYDERYTCKIKCEEKANEEFIVQADSISHTLLQDLSTRWIIRAHPQRHNATQAELLLRFKFRSRLYNSVSSIFGKSVTELVMKAFEKRVFELRKRSLQAATNASNM